MRRPLVIIVAAALLLVGAAPAAPPDAPVSYIGVEELKLRLDRGEKPDLHLVFQPHILLPLIGLGLLALVPVAYKRWKQRS